MRKFKISSIFFSDFQGNLFISSYQAASKSLACICVSHKNARSLMTTLTHTQTNKNISVSIWYSLMIMFSQVTMQIDILTVLSDILLAMVLDVYSMPIPLFSTSVIDLTLNSPLLFHFTYCAVLIIAGCPLVFTLSLVRFWDLEQPSLNPKLVGVSYTWILLCHSAWLYIKSSTMSRCFRMKMRIWKYWKRWARDTHTIWSARCTEVC